MKKELAEQIIGDALGFRIENLAQYRDGFSFTTDTELEAYKAAYKYHGPNNRLVVRFAPNVGKWSVQLYNTREIKAVA